MTQRWETHTTDWTLWLRALGRASSTIATRVEHIRWLARDTKADDPWSLTTSDLVAWLGSHEWARETRRGVRASLRGFWRWGIVDGRAVDDPTAVLPAPRPSVPAPHPTPERVYETALFHAPPAARLMLRLAAEAGLRRAEVAQVHARDVHETSGGWSLTVHGKGGKERQVPIPPGLAWDIRTKCQGGFAFPGSIQGHVSPQWVGVRISRLLPDGMSIHGLRHRFGSVAYALSNDLLGIQQLLGHASPTTTQIYVLIPDERLRTIVDAVAGQRVAQAIKANARAPGGR
ncbi:tyrosine-type recombinase/integrase [Promicromonospora sp. NPDC023805]|uniref:tyrosine-type recombinase/integrase n=1 Tax=Promicromonospora sp. NPDC023805 TaxID=3154696 RepID=UPI0033D788F7